MTIFRTSRWKVENILSAMHGLKSRINICGAIMPPVAIRKPLHRQATHYEMNYLSFVFASHLVILKSVTGWWRVLGFSQKCFVPKWQVQSDKA